LGKVKNAVRSWLNKMVNVKSPNILESNIADKQKLWKDMYLDNAPWTRKKNVHSLNLAAALVAKISWLITMEMKSEVNDDRVNEIYQKEVLKNIRTQVEYGLALGGIILKPYASNGQIMIDFAQATDFVVDSFSNDGTITGVTFKDYTECKGSVFLRLETHTFDEHQKTYLIANKVYKSDEHGTVGTEVKDYSFIEIWANLNPETLFANIKAPLFGYFKPATSNNVDTKSPLGISIYARAVDAIKRADIQLSSLVREFKVKEAKQYISHLAVKSAGELPYLEDDYYIKLNMGGKNASGEEFFESYSPAINEISYLAGLNEYKKEIEDCIGLSHGTISEMEMVAKTATEIQMSRQLTYVMIKENQKNLDDALKDAVYAIGVWLNYPKLPPDYLVTTDFDDSIINDKEAVLKSMAEDVAAGLLKPEIYLAKKYGVDEKKALEMMPESESLLMGTPEAPPGRSI